MGESVSVSVHIEIDGKSAVDEVYTSNNREAVASAFEDWAEVIRDFDDPEVAVPDQPDRCLRCGGAESVRTNPWTRQWEPCPECTPEATDA